MQVATSLRPRPIPRAGARHRAASALPRVVALHEKDRADDRAAPLCDPAVLAGRIEFGDEGAEDAARETLVGPVPAVFLMIENGLAMDDPADVARPKRAAG